MQKHVRQCRRRLTRYWSRYLRYENQFNMIIRICITVRIMVILQKQKATIQYPKIQQGGLLLFLLFPFQQMHCHLFSRVQRPLLAEKREQLQLMVFNTLLKIDFQQPTTYHIPKTHLPEY